MMEHRSLSESTCAPTSATPSVGSSGQPTYTTAGTIYNPSSSQPLQPPTRRGRSLKWPAGSVHSDLALLPKSVLAGLSLKASAGHSIPSVQHYTPLQQNYDRAISPLNEKDHILAKMPADTSQKDSARIPRHLSADMSETSNHANITVNDDELRSGNGSEEEEEHVDDDDNHNMSALMAMPVKSLQSLASYPNPNRKNAQKALLRGGTRSRPCTLTSSIGSAVSTSPIGMPSFNITAGPSETGQNSSSSKHLGLLADSSTPRRAQLDAISRIDGAWSTRHNTPAPALPNPPRAKSASSEVSKASNKHASGSGTPMPLTAGPPGQRQYRPSTFETTFKALKTNSPPATSTQEDDDAILITTQTMIQAGIEDFPSMYDTSDIIPSVNTTSPEHRRADRPLQMHGYRLPSGIIDSEEEFYSSHAQLQGITDRMKVWDPSEQLIQPPSWRDQSPEVRALYTTGTDRLTDEALADRNGKLEEWWFSGVNRAYRRPDITGLRYFAPREVNHFGVIGDRRPVAATQRPRVIDMEQAVAIPVAEHTRSLIELVIDARGKSRLEKLSSSEELNQSTFIQR